MSNHVIACLALLLIPAAAAAESQPEPTFADQRIKTLTYQPDQVFAVKTHQFVSTLIQFGDDETLRGDVPLVGGDLEAWSIAFVGERAIALKPIQSAPHTNLTVITTQRVYHFDLDISTDKRTNDTATYAIRFIYPEHQQREQEAAELAERENEAWRLSQRTVDPVEINLNYRLRGAKKLRPRQIFDDGKFTYFLFDDKRPVPAVFAVDNDLETLVNFSRQGAYLLVQRLAERFILRAGKAKAEAIRELDNTDD